MAVGEIPDQIPAGEKCCALCQHAVSARGQEQLVCLAYLTLRLPTQGRDCLEFEPARQRSAPAAP